MKTLSYLIPLIILLVACSSNDDEADAYGNFEVDTRYISSEVSGKLLSIPIEEGYQIDTGGIIARIDTTQLSLRKSQFKASIRAIKSRLQDVPVQLASLTERETILRKEIQRTSALLEDGAATKKQLDDLTGELHVIIRQLEATKSQLSTANQSILAEMEPLQWQIRQLEDQIAKSTLTAPVGGTILEKFKEPGELIMLGQPVVKIGDLTQMTLRAYISGDQLGSLKIGQEVTVRADEPGGTLKNYQAKVSWISSEAEFTPKVIQTKEERTNLVYAVKFQIANDGFLKIGMPGEVIF